MQVRKLATAAAGTAQAAPTALVMLNMGGPETIADVRPFLQRLFADSDLLRLPFQATASRFIARRRSPQIEEQYRAIGGGSPIRRWTQRQGELLAARLAEVAPELGAFRAYTAFRYAAPLTDECVAQLLDDGVRRAVAFSQYPQYSCATSGSSLNELHRVLRRADPQRRIRWSVIDRWPLHDGLVRILAERVRAALREFGGDAAPSARPTVLFSAHSLPLSAVDRGDPYVTEVAATCAAVMREVGDAAPWRLVWQSQVGPSRWMGPNTMEAIRGLARLGRRRVVLVPVAFTSDHIETLYELDREYSHEAAEIGVQVHRTPSLNDDPAFIDALASLVRGHFTSEVPAVSSQLLLRCPGCRNDSCGQMRGYFNAFGQPSLG